MDIAGIGLLVFLAFAQWLDMTKPPENPDDTMIVSAVIVPDSFVGDDPPVVYNRTIARPFYGRWKAQIFPVETVENENQIDKKSVEPACTGTGSTLYGVSDAPQGITLAWYMGKECNLKAGVYFIDTVWIIKDDVTIRNTSNIFTIREPGSPSHDIWYGQ